MDFSIYWWSWNQSPLQSDGQLYLSFGGVKATCRFLTVRGLAPPSTCVVQGSTVMSERRPDQRTDWGGGKGSRRKGHVQRPAWTWRMLVPRLKSHKVTHATATTWEPCSGPDSSRTCKPSVWAPRHTAPACLRQQPPNGEPPSGGWSDEHQAFEGTGSGFSTGVRPWVPRRWLSTTWRIESLPLPEGSQWNLGWFHNMHQKS